MIIILGFACINNNSRDQDLELPPSELLTSNYKIADQVCVTTLVEIVPKDTFFTDRSEPGYIRYLFKTKIKRIFKGNLENDSILEFSTSVEYSRNFIPFWLNQKELLVFLKKNNASHEFYAIEAGIIPYSDKLDKKTNKLFIEAGNP